jgi:four helix bundle protein
MDFVVQVYRVTEQFPKDERFGLISQLRRAAVSVPANIAEGAGRKSDKEFVYFLSNAQGSASEIETELIIGHRLGYLSDDELQQLCMALDRIGSLISGLTNYLKRRMK